MQWFVLFAGLATVIALEIVYAVTTPDKYWLRFGTALSTFFILICAFSGWICKKCTDFVNSSTYGAIATLELKTHIGRLWLSVLKDHRRQKQLLEADLKAPLLPAQN